MSDTDTRLTLTPQETADMLGTSRDTVMKLLSEGHLREVPRVTRRRLIVRRSVLELLGETS